MKNTNEADSPFSLPSNNFNLRADRGPSATDFRHLISGFISKRLPRGFAISTIFQATSALPYNITTGFDDNGDTVINDRPMGVGRNSARGAARWEIGSRFSWGKDFGPEQQQTGGPQMQDGSRRRRRWRRSTFNRQWAQRRSIDSSSTRRLSIFSITRIWAYSMACKPHPSSARPPQRNHRAGWNSG